VRQRGKKRLGLSVCMVLVACGPTPGAERPGDLQPASLGEPARAALVVGCWSLDWGGGPGRGPDGLAVLPDSVRLRDQVVFATRERQITPATHPDGRGVVGGREPAWETRYLLNRWWIEEDLLQVRFSDGEDDEWRVALTIESEDLSGVARYEGDRPAPTESDELGVRGTRITCEF